MNTVTGNAAYRRLALFNILAFVVMILFNALAVFLPLNDKTTGQLSDQYPNLFTPAGITFSIWSLIYLFLLGFIVYQARVLFSARHFSKEKIARISPLFILNGFANASWIVAWHYEKVVLSVFIMIVLLTTLLLIHERLKLALPLRPALEKYWLDIPFSLYMGWIVIATIANVTALLVDLKWTGGGLSEASWTNIMIAVGCVIGLMMIFYKNNIVFGLVGIWSFYGIILKRQAAGDQESRSVIICAGIALGILASAALIQLFRRSKRGFMPEGMPDINPNQGK